MGDRAVWGFQAYENGPILYLYSQWEGGSQLSRLQAALAHASDRIGMGDTAYAMRICVSQVMGNVGSTSTGWGLSINEFDMPDYENLRLVRFWDKTVALVDCTTSEAVAKPQPIQDFLNRPVKIWPGEMTLVDEITSTRWELVGSDG